MHLKYVKALENVVYLLPDENAEDATQRAIEGDMCGACETVTGDNGTYVDER